jgi:hypothetical protein
MVRKLLLIAALLAGAVTSASAQSRATLVARKDTAFTNRTGLLVHVSGLVDDPQWADPLAKGYTVQVHWEIQLWKKGGRYFGLGDDPQPKIEFDVEVQTNEFMPSYSYTERTRGGPKRFVFTKMDSLRVMLATDLIIPGPPLEAGDWYYNVVVDIRALTQDQIDQRDPGSGGVLSGLINRLVMGSGPRKTLTKTVPVIVPR